MTVESGGAEGPVTAPAETTARTVATVTKVSVLTSVAVAVLFVATNIVNARLFGAEVLGLFALASSPWLLALAISNFGENAALIRSLSTRPRKSPRTLTLTAATVALSTAWTAVVCMVITGVVVTLLATVVADDEIFVPALVLTTTYVVLVNPTWVLQSPFIAYSSAFDLAVARLIPPVCFLAASAVLGATDPTLWNLVLAWVVSAVVGLVYTAFRALAFVGGGMSRPGFREAGSEIRRIVSFAGRAWPGNLAHALSTQAGLWTVTAFAGTVQAGVFSRVLGLQERAVDLSYRLQDGLFPAMVRYHAVGEHGALRALWWRTMAPALGLAAAFLTPLAIEADAAMGVLGPEFVSGANALRWVAGAAWLTLVLSGFVSMFFATDRAGVSSLLTVGKSAVALALLIPATRWYGAAGASSVYAVTTGGEILGRSLILRRLGLFDVRDCVRPARDSLVCAAVAAGATLAVQPLASGSLVGELVAMSLGMGSGVVAWLGLRHLRRRTSASLAPPGAVASLSECSYPQPADRRGTSN